MNQNQSVFEKQTVYHSQLVAESPLVVKITSDVLKSKWKDQATGADKFYVNFEHNSHKHSLNLENQNCEQAVAGLSGQLVTITASGSRDDAALDVQPYDGPQQSTPQRQQAPAQRQAPAPQRQQPAQQQGGWVPEGMAVGNAITNACANITARGDEITESALHDIATRILRVAYKLGHGKFYAPAAAAARQQQPRQSEPAPLPAAGANERRAPEQDVDMDMQGEGVPF